MESRMVECVNSSLRLYMYRNATFLCERLCAEYPSENNFQLLASCYLRNNQAYRAYHILKGTQLAQSRYLFAISCFEMGRLREAEVALCPLNESSTEVPNGAAGHYLLGLIYRYTDRRKIAIEHFLQAVSLDPFLWAAYEELCILGAEEEAADLYGDSAVFRLQQQQLQWDLSSQYLASAGDERSMPSSRSSYSNDASPRQAKQLAASSAAELPAGHAAVSGSGNIGIPFQVNMSAYNTPSPVPSHVAAAAPPPLNRNIQGQPNPTVIAGDVSPRSNANAPGQAPRRKFMDEGKLRKSIRSSSTRAAYSQVSGRLFSESVPRRSTRLSGDASAQITSSVLPVGGNGSGHSSAKLLGGMSSTSKMNASSSLRSGTVRKGHPLAIDSSLDEGKKYDVFEDSGSDDMPINASRRTGSVPMDDEPRMRNRASTLAGVMTRGSRVAEGALELLGLLRILGEAFRHFCMHRCKEALQSFSKLPHQQYATGWVLCQVGKAHFEMVDYLEAERAFSWARRVSPYCLEGMDIYSTVLYHMKEEMKLSYLAQELNAIDRLSPQAWCALGNCYSLQKDHETALKTFQRAIQLDSRFTYAHTLCGHEYVAMEEFENGITCYRSALRIDPRHYNAWYGLGMIYLRQEKYDFAEHHFRTAFQINARSSVLMCYLGMALHALKRNEEALEMLDRAILADTKNPLPIYQKANVLMSNERFEDALEELEQLKEVAPRESSVYSLIGKIYKRLNEPEQAMYHFGLALDLKPSTADVAIIKSAIEKLHVPDDIEEHL
eukprot:Gb_21601 [translate_table: standard]